MKFLKIGAWMVGLLCVSGAAHAQFSSTITGTTDYDFRGFSQSAKDPAIQGSLDYAFPAGFAIGTWASNVDFDNDADVELDFYGNYTGKINDDTSWQIGFNAYTYPSSDDVKDYVEYFVGLSAGMFGVKQWYSDDLFKSGSSGAYTEGNFTYPLPQNFNVQLHAGYAWGDYWKDDNLGGGEIFDFSAGVGYSVHNFDLLLRVTGTDASGAQKIKGDTNNNEPRVVFSVATTLPWSGE